MTDKTTLDAKQYTSMDDLLSVRVEPLEEDYELQIGGKPQLFRITGLRTYRERQAVLAEIAHWRSEVPAINHNGETFVPDDSDVVAAIWCAACIREPNASALQWARLAQSSSVALKMLYVRCLVCSREIEDPEKPNSGPLALAKEALEADPLEQHSDVSASKS